MPSEHGFSVFELRQLTYFVAVAEELNYRKAAERTFVSQPALSYQMNQLEERLGVRLLERDHRGVSLTSAGQLFLQGARDLLSQAARLTRDVQELDGGPELELQVALEEYLHIARMPQAIRLVREQFQGLRLKTTHLPMDEHVEGILARRLDLGFAPLPVEHPDLVSKPLLQGHWTVVLPALHRLAQREQVTLGQLQGEPIILPPERSNPRTFNWFLESCRSRGFEAEVAYEASQPRLAPALVAEGVGLWVTLSFSYNELPPEVTARPLLDLEPREMTLGLVWHRQSRSQARRLFVEQLLNQT
ncbi:LysR family transcriptional regulator [bacterium]|nr:LysR family transcriptional regulator [bacterium]